MTAGRLAWPLFGGYVVMSTAGVALLAAVPAAAVERDGGTFWLTVSFVVVNTVFGLVGAVVASRMPQNPVGWLFLGLALIDGAFELAYGYTFFSLMVDSQPATAYTAWFASWSSVVSPTLIALAFLLFPNGALPSRRWRAVAWLCVLVAVPVVAHYAFVPGPIADFPEMRNPLGLSWAGFLRDLSPDPFFATILVSAVVAVIVRFRRSRGVERQQLKWFAWAAGLLVSFILVVALIPQQGDEGAAETAGGFAFAVIISGLPISAGIAILRYRLYDIDLVIKRTLIYGALTALLVGAYLVSVLVFRLVLDPITGESDLAVAGSTLAVAALFRPLRAGVQSQVDQRFYRQRYDAVRTLDGFSAHLRDELDLDSLGTDLRAVVSDTMQPAHVTLWLRSET